VTAVIIAFGTFVVNLFGFCSQVLMSCLLTSFFFSFIQCCCSQLGAVCNCQQLAWGNDHMRHFIGGLSSGQIWRTFLWQLPRMRISPFLFLMNKKNIQVSSLFKHDEVSSLNIYQNISALRNKKFLAYFRPYLQEKLCAYILQVFFINANDPRTSPRWLAVVFLVKVIRCGSEPPFFLAVV
jgi:hypothetical protein